MEKIDKRLIKRTIIHVRIQDNPKQLRGLLRFPTESFSTKILPMKNEVQYKKNQVLFKNQAYRQEEGEEDQQKKKMKDMELYSVTLTPQHLKSQQFKVEIPIVRGPKSAKNNRPGELCFTFYYQNSQGRLVLQNGMYDAKKQVINKNKKELSFKDKMEIQLSKLDNRRKDEIDQHTFRKEEAQESEDEN